MSTADTPRSAIGRRGFLHGMGAAGASGALLWQLQPDASAAQATRPQHVVQFVFDDAEWPDFGFTNPTDIDTPNVNAVRASGAFLPNYYTMSGCTPTRYGLIGGQNPMAWGVTGAENDNATMQLASATGMGMSGPTIASMLRDSGYLTGIVGKWHVGLGRDTAWPDQRGYDYCQIKTSGTNNGGEVGLTSIDRIETRTDVPYSDLLYAQKAIEFIEAAVRGGVQSYLSVNWHTPHTSWSIAPGGYDNPNGYDLETGRGRKQAAMHLCDSLIGDVLAAYGDLSNVLVLITSDNGAPFEKTERKVGAQGPNDHQRGYKTEFYEGGVNMPFVAAWPAGGIAPDSTHLGPVCAWDLAASLATVVGAHFTGKGALDRSGALIGGDPAVRAPWFIENGASINPPKVNKPWEETRQFVVFDWPMKYLQGTKKDLTWRLFDVDADPSEDNPLPVTETQHDQWMGLLHRLRDDVCRTPLGAWRSETDPNTRPWSMRIRLDGAGTYVDRSDHIKVTLRANGRLRVQLSHRNADGSGPHRQVIKAKGVTSGELWITVTGYKRGYPVVRVFLDGEEIGDIRDMFGMWENTAPWTTSGNVTYWTCEITPEEFAHYP